METYQISIYRHKHVDREGRLLKTLFAASVILVLGSYLYREIVTNARYEQSVDRAPTVARAQ